MQTSSKQTMSWYDTPLGRLSGGETRRRAQPSVPEVVAELSGAADSRAGGLAWALAMGSGRIPFIP